MKIKNKVGKRDIEFLFEIGSLRFIQRTWKRFLNPDVENLTEHHFRVTWIALLIAKHEGVQLTEKIIKMALVHDFAESRTGDVDYLSRQYVVRNEELGIRDMLLDTALEKEFLEIWQEYEKRQTLESKIVKDADNLAIDFELREQGSKGNNIGKGGGWKEIREFVASNKLYTKTAKAIWRSLQTADPHDWHYKGRNRRNRGDWKK
ncbi:MAG: HD domain-containing protein [Candidatus Levybacteria bacterium]|nr:HD domain-containing protein [Candidatus Levybacteria bacterium]